MTIVRQLALSQVRRKSEERKAMINAQIEAMKNRQIEIEKIMRKLLSQGNQINNSMGGDVDDDNDVDEDMDDDEDDEN